MRVADIIRRAGRSLRQAKGRTALTALAISVGAFTITLALAAGAGGKQYVDNMLSANGDERNLMVFAKVESHAPAAKEGPAEFSEAPIAEEQATSGGGSLLTQKDVDRVRSVDGIESVAPMLDISATYMQGPSNKKFESNVQIKVDKTALELVAGSLKDSQPSKGKVVIPESYVEPLGYKTAKDAIGKTISLTFMQYGATELDAPVSKSFSYVVQAVDTQGKSALQYSEAVRVSAADGEQIFAFQSPESVNNYYGMTAQVESGRSVREVQDAVNAKGYETFSLEDTREAMFTAVNVAMTALAGFGALATLASIFGVINTMYISVLERTQQIGLMKALGMRRRDISRLFLFEAAWIGFLGGAIGAGSAVVLGLVANPFISDFTNAGEGVTLLVFQPVAVIGIVAGLMIVAVLSGFFPSRKAAKLDPIEALRTE